MKLLDPDIASEKYFATGLIFTILSLYCASIYTYFSNDSGLTTLRDVNVQVMIPQGDIDNDSILDMTRTSSVLSSSEDEVEALFRPINAGTRVYVPGTKCTLTDLNLAPTGVLYGVPDTCKFLIEEAR
tara:strand:+ start:351 stop:734 length:384 start_codon:yes stop_codon:yes gene_type:complete